MLIKKINKISAAIAIAAFSITSVNAQQLKVPAPSPLQTVKQAFALDNITIEYSRPSVKGRVVLVMLFLSERYGAQALTLQQKLHLVKM